MSRGVPYKLIRNSIEVGDIIVCDNSESSFIGFLIGLVSNFTHAAIVSEATDDNNAGRVEVSEALLGEGLDENYLSERYEDKHGDIYWIPMHCRLSEKEEIKRIIKEKRMKKIKYDIKSFLLAPLGWISLDAEKFICSEWVWFILVAIKKFVNKMKGKKKLAPNPQQLVEWIGKTPMLIDMSKK